MNISGRLLIHFKCRITIREKRIFIFDSNHVLFDQNIVITPAVDFNIVCAEINPECIVCQNDNPFLTVTNNFYFLTSQLPGS